MTLRSYILKEYRDELVAVINVIRRAEQYLGPSDDWVEDDRRILFEALDGFGGHDFTRKKGTDDYICTTQASPNRVEEILLGGPYQRNILSTRKYRTHHGGGKQWARGSFVVDHPDTDWQHHVYIFPSADGGTDIYGHREDTVRDPRHHLNVAEGDDLIQKSGDPSGRVRRLLDNNGLSYRSRRFDK